MLPAVLAGLLLSAAPASAQIPPDVEAMIREAARIGNATTVAAVVEVAKSMNPEQAEEIAKFGASLPVEGPNLPPPPRPAIPPEVEAMIREAGRTHDAATIRAVVDVAKATNPEDLAAIDALGATLLAEATPPPPIPPTVEAMIREAGRSGDATTLASVVKVAKSNNPANEKAIDALGIQQMTDVQTRNREAAKRAREAEEARLASLGTFEGWSGQGELGLGLATGNTDQFSALLGIKLAKDGLVARHKIAAVIDYQETDGLRSRERYAFSHSLNYLLHEGLYIATLLGWESDRFAGFDDRFTESVGMGYRVISTPRMTLDLEGGPALRQSFNTDGTDENEFGARASLAFRWTLRDGMSFSQDASLVSSGGNTTIITNSAFTTKLSNLLSARVSFNLQNESDPQPDRKPTDTATRASIVYSF